MQSPLHGSARLLTLAALVLLPVAGMAQDSPPAEKTPAETAKPAGQAAVRVSRSALCLRVEEREPVDVDTVFPADVGQVIAYTKLEDVGGPTRITHVWYYGDREMARVPLPVGGNGWRTWSSKKILPAWTGNWKVEILDADGTRVKTLEFRVGDTGTAEPAG